MNNIKCYVKKDHSLTCHTPSFRDGVILKGSILPFLSRSEPGLHRLIKEAVAKRWQAVTSLLRASVLQPEPASLLWVSFLNPCLDLTTPDPCEGVGGEGARGATPHTPWQLSPVPPKWDPGVLLGTETGTRSRPSVTGRTVRLEATRDLQDTAPCWKRPRTSSRSVTSRTKASSPTGTCRWDHLLSMGLTECDQTVPWELLTILVHASIMHVPILSTVYILVT